MALRFGTDGLRGVANVELTAEVALCLGRAAARHLRAETFLLGSDTRQSSPMLKEALAAGIAAEGINVVDLGVLPTPGLAFLAASQNVPGAMVSASHNPYTDNGIKLLSPSGSKLADATEAAIEADLEQFLAQEGSARAPQGAPGEITIDARAIEIYIEHLIGVFDDADASRLSIICDCANGAASAIGPKVFDRLGLNVELICAEPDGTNINESCGSTHPERLASAVLERHADLGIAFDGDADRLIAVAGDGTIVDGDAMLAMFAVDLADRHELANNGVVVTVMANLGLHRRLKQAGINVIETAVGDRSVADALEANGLILGGEQSGHIAFRRHATTGDGILTALKLIELLVRTDKTLAASATEALTRIPQELRTVPVKAPERLDDAALVWDEVEAINARLGSNGRVLLRASGTESAVRVMVEAEDPKEALDVVNDLAVLIRRELGEASTT